MKKNQFLLGAVGLLALGLTACSNEMPVNDGNGVAEKDEVRFLRVAIASPSDLTRTGDADFQKAKDDEVTVENMYFKFYDINGNHIEAPSLNVDDFTTTPATGVNAGNVGVIKETVLQISLKRGEKYPAYVVCFLNPVDFNPVKEMTGKMETLRNLERGAYANAGGKFTMSNSVYFGTDPLTSAVNVKMSGAPIKASQLYTTAAAAKEATASAVDIYVERYAAKVNFNLATDAVEDFTYGAYTLQFNPEFWSINADAPSMYAIKRFADNDAATDGIPDMDSVDEMLEGWNTWNDPTKFRSYWGCSPAFYSTTFPRVSDDIIDKMTDGTSGAGYPEFGKPATATGYSLRYYSYNQIATTTGTSFGKGVTAEANSDVTATKYTLENTMGKAAFNSVNPKAAAPSAVLLGNYTVKKGDTELEFTNGFCLYNEGIYAVGATAPAGEKTILNHLLDQNSILYTAQVNDGITTYVRLNSTNVPDNQTGNFEVVHPSKAVRGEQAVPHRYVTLQIKSGVTDFTGLYYKPDGASDFIPVEVNEGQTAAQVVANINTLLWQQVGNASQYTNGKCYFSIPIQHLGYTESEDGAPVTDGVLDWEKVKVGDFGLVRNHVYTIKVTSITGRADGIQGLDNPLVPSMDETNYFVKYRINILNWRIVPEQGVVL